ncbi:MAG: multiheme c-type cytochrome [Candidatus Aminicenantes bacterium]|nr:multiheme c-type cytochrome [Candidatus Aminicenantes bacterium]
MIERRLKFPALLVLVLAGFLTACSTTPPSNGVTPVEIPAASMSYIVLAWNDLGMHDLNPTYDKEVLLPPYNTLWAQVIKRGDPPEIVTTGVSLEYRVIDNTYSYGKGTASPLRNYGQFWDNSLDLFGVSLANDTGLNLVDPDIHNGLSGAMLLKGNHFEVDGIPVVPINDAGTWDPYQVAEIIVRDASTGTELARTRATVPTSDEINCAKCHGQTVNSVAILSVLAEHDKGEETTFATDGVPVLCADCHGSPALGQTGPGSSELYLSQVIHGFHSTKSAACYDCHPGATTKCSRSTAHATADGNCTTCHGTMANITTTITNGRVPWVSEPKCVSCHTFVAEVDTGSTLYRNADAHNGISCPACHGSPHAEVPSDKAVDNYQALQYQNKALPLGSCKVCHSGSKGGGLTGIVDAHGGSQPTSCMVCHTGPISTNNPLQFPHRFQQRSR